MEYKIYLVKNKINNKSYIGQTKQKVKDRIKRHILDSKNGSDLLFHRALRKYGIENFEVKVLSLTTKEKANEHEIYFINKFDTYKNGYNLTLGGKDTKHLKEKDVIEKIMKKRYGHILEKEKRNKFIAKPLTDWINENGIVPLYGSDNGNFKYFFSNIETKELKTIREWFILLGENTNYQSFFTKINNSAESNGKIKSLGTYWLKIPKEKINKSISYFKNLEQQIKKYKRKYGNKNTMMKITNNKKDFKTVREWSKILPKELNKDEEKIIFGLYSYLRSNRVGKGLCYGYKWYTEEMFENE